MKYVARYTQNPEGDIERGWSRWSGASWKSFQSAAEDVLLWHAGIEVTEDDDVETLLDKHSFTIKQDPHFGDWAQVHHDGISVYALDADNETDAFAEASQMPKFWIGGEGDCTVGNVRYVGQVFDGLHLFVCDDTVKEQ